MTELKDLRVGDEISYVWKSPLVGFNHYWSLKIESIEEMPACEVGCIEVEKYHRFIANGIVSGNSELPLSPYDSCRLLLLNLYGYVKNPFRKNAYFDFEAFAADAQLAQRLMDDVIDLELECIDRILAKVDDDPEPDDVKYREVRLWERIRQECAEGRRTGTGITALGDVIASSGLPYGSQEAIELTSKIYRTLKLSCYRSSVDMAKELGAFPIWDKEKEKDCHFLHRIRDEDPELFANMQKYGRRNISLLTTAPAGSISCESQTTSGIEPAFCLSYIRRKKVNPSDTNARIDFVDQNGDSWQEFKVYHHKLRDWMEITGNDDISQSPYAGSCAEELDWKQRVKLQAAATKELDHSVSSTLNLPEDVTVEKVKEIYNTAWKSGTKGITVYRRNCRTGVLVDDKNTRGKLIRKTTAPLRPKSLDCCLHVWVVKGEPHFVVVGLLNNDPYEIFAGIYSELSEEWEGCGKIVKEKRGNYNVYLEDGRIIKDVSSLCGSEIESLTRMTSAALRHGSDMAFIVHQLEKARGDMHSFAKVMVRSLKKYVKDGTSVYGDLCQGCQSTNLIRQEGCVKCASCGWSKC